VKILRNILLPFVPIYFLITWIRNIFFDIGILSTKAYNLPIICVGNLSVGGTGKTPMIEYIIRLLKDSNEVATLSRGYKRETKGFIVASENASARTIGDEPFQFYSKFKDIIVSVDENRQRGISSLMDAHNDLDVILLDDAYQHRKVKAGLNILLTTYGNLYCNDILLPTGNLREPRSGANRADVIIITKCPELLNDSEKKEIENRLKVLPHQRLFFSSITYSDAVQNQSQSHPISILNDQKFSLVTGIANARPMVAYLKSKGFDFDHLNFSDHHKFSKEELIKINEKKLILTTEKDFGRLKDSIKNKGLFYLPIEMKVSNGTDLDQLIRNFAAS